MKKISQRRLLITPLCIGLLTSCSASYKATRVTPQQVTTAKPGIYYALPRTELLVVAGVKKSTTKTGIYAGDVWDTCTTACKNNPSGTCKGKPKGIEKAYELTNLKAYSRVVADADHIYYVNVDLKAFAAFSHTFKLNSEGILTSSSSEIENKTAEVAINTTKALAKLLTETVMAKAPDDGIKCSDFKPMYEKSVALKNRVDSLRKSLDDVLFAKPAPTGPAIEQLIKRHEERVRELKNSSEFIDLTQARQKSKEEEDVGGFAVLLEPREFTPVVAGADSWKPIQTIAPEGFAGLEVKPALETEIEPVTRLLDGTKVTVEVAPLMGFSALNADATEPNRATGYRYRFPAAATVTVKRGDQIIGNSRVLVAQYGAITAMPSKIFGVKSKIALDLYESTGAPRQVDIGATSQPSNIVGDTLTPVQDELDRRNKAKEEAKKKAEAAEQDALTKERDLLKLKKEIRELEQATETAIQGEAS